MVIEEPFFLSNSEWYVEVDLINDGFPEDGRGFHLTDNAPAEAVKSYEEFYELMKSTPDKTEMK